MSSKRVVNVVEVLGVRRIGTVVIALTVMLLVVIELVTGYPAAVEECTATPPCNLIN